MKMIFKLFLSLLVISNVVSDETEESREPSSVEQVINETVSHNFQQTKRDEISKTSKEMFKHAYFHASTRFSGTTYLLSREALFFYPSFGQAMCGLVEGYLVEINSRKELDFIKRFISVHGSNFDYVMAGGTDEGHEGMWYNRYSQTKVEPLWYPGEPNNDFGRQNCQSFTKEFNWELDDIECVFNNNNRIGFVCELNE